MKEISIHLRNCNSDQFHLQQDQYCITKNRYSESKLAERYILNPNSLTIEDMITLSETKFVFDVPISPQICFDRKTCYLMTSDKRIISLNKESLLNTFQAPLDTNVFYAYNDMVFVGCDNGNLHCFRNGKDIIKKSFFKRFISSSIPIIAMTVYGNFVFYITNDAKLYVSNSTNADIIAVRDLGFQGSIHNCIIQTNGRHLAIAINGEVSELYLFLIQSNDLLSFVQSIETYQILDITLFDDTIEIITESSGASPEYSMTLSTNLTLLQKTEIGDNINTYTSPLYRSLARLESVINPEIYQKVNDLRLQNTSINQIARIILPQIDEKIIAEVKYEKYTKSDNRISESILLDLEDFIKCYKPGEYDKEVPSTKPFHSLASALLNFIVHLDKRLISYFLLCEAVQKDIPHCFTPYALEANNAYLSFLPLLNIKSFENIPLLNLPETNLQPQIQYLLTDIKPARALPVPQAIDFLMHLHNPTSEQQEELLMLYLKESLYRNFKDTSRCANLSEQFIDYATDFLYQHSQYDVLIDFLTERKLNSHTLSMLVYSNFETHDFDSAYWNLMCNIDMSSELIVELAKRMKSANQYEQFLSLPFAKNLSKVCIYLLKSGDDESLSIAADIYQRYGVPEKMKICHQRAANSRRH